MNRILSNLFSKIIKLFFLLFVLWIQATPIIAQMGNIDPPGTGSIHSLEEENGILFASTDAGVFRSANHGDSWTQIVNGIRPNCQNSKFYSFSKIGDTVYLAGCGGPYYSINTGFTWDSISSYRDIGAIATKGQYIFGATIAEEPHSIFGDILRSSDFGVTWSTINTGLPLGLGGTPSMHVNSLLVKGEYVFAGTPNGVFRSSNNGENWERMNATLSEKNVISMIALGKFIVIGTDIAGIYQSSDDGKTWNNTAAGRDYFGTRAFVVKGENIYAGTQSGVFVSKDSGSTWKLLNSNFTKFVNALTVSGENLYCGHFDLGVSRLTLNGDYSKLIIHNARFVKAERLSFKMGYVDNKIIVEFISSFNAPIKSRNIKGQESERSKFKQ